MEIKSFSFDSNGKENVKNEEKGSNWPVVYLISNEDYLYIGETTSASKRMDDHLKSRSKMGYHFKDIHIVFDDEYNKSVILDYEQRLIKCCKTDAKYKVINLNAGQSASHDYYQRDNYSNKFANLWNELKSEGLVKESLDKIENEEIFKYSPYNSLTEEQNDISAQIINDFCEMLENKTSAGRISLVNGCAGTGKTVLAISIINSLLNAKFLDPNDFTDDDKDDDKIKALLRLKKYLDSSTGHPLKIGFVFPMSGIRKTIKRVFKECGNGLKANMVLSPYDLKNEDFDILFVDEAHRLFRRKNLGNAFKNFDNTCSILGFDKNVHTQLNWVLKQGKYNVLFYDEDQSIRSTDITYNDFHNTLDNSGKSIKNFTLKTQMRCDGGNTYVQYLKNVINCSQADFKDITNYDFKIFDDVDAMVKKIQTLDFTLGLCRTVAGYSWKWVTKPEANKPKDDLSTYKQIESEGKYDIDIQGYHYIWNLTTEDWISRQHSSVTIGCIHTTQGFDLNYVGVIFGEEIDYDPINNCLVVDLDKFYDKAAKNGCKPDEVKKYIINTYTTFMARGIKGCYVYACNKNLQNYLSNFIRKYKE